MNPELAQANRAQVEEFRRKHRTGLLTLVFTDIVGSTALKQGLGDREAATLFQDYRALVRSQRARFSDSEEIETAGDSFLLVFATPSQAVEFALALQTQLESWSKARGIGLQQRVGIHLGEVVIEEHAGAGKAKDLYGGQLDVCARVMSLAGANQILMTRAVFDNARQLLKGEDLPEVGRLKWLNHGPYLFKGLEEPMEVCEVRLGTEGPVTPPTSTEKAQRVAAEGELVLGWRPAIGQEVPGSEWGLEKKLGEGGFGEVWLAKHHTLKELRVFKFCFRADRVRSLKREVTLFRLLKERIGEHPNIVRLYDVFFDQPPFYLEEEYVSGKDLKSWCEAQGGLEQVPLEVRLEIMAQAADGLQAAHDAGVIHRDVKPGNILISTVSALVRAQPTSSDVVAAEDSAALSRARLQVTAKLTDFGIGQVLSEEYLSGITRAGFTQTMMGPGSSSQTGTQMYMAPELFASKPASIRSDIYSLGVVLYQLLVGDFTRPVTTDWANDITDTLLRDDLQHCFAGNPQDRFAGAGQLAKHLRALPQRQRAQVEQEATVAALARVARRRRAWARAAIILGTIFVLAVIQIRQLIQANRELEKRELTARQNLYAADMILAFQALEASALNRARDLVQKQTPKPGEKDLRGWEWRYLWKQCQGDELFTLGTHSDCVTVAAFFPNGRTVASASKDKTVKLWDLESRRLIETLPHPNEVDALAISPDAKLLATGCNDGTIRLWDAATRKVIINITNAPYVNALVFSSDGKALAWADADRAVVWDLAARRELASYPCANYPNWKTGIALSGDRRYFAFGQRYGKIEIWDWENHSLKAVLTGHEKEVLALAFFDGGKRLVSGANDATARVWNVDTGREIAKLTSFSSWVGSFAFSRDGKTLAAASADQTLKLWHTKTWEEIATLRGHEFEVWWVAYSPDGGWLVTASLDGTIKVWDPNFRRESKIVETLPTDAILGSPTWFGTAPPISPDGKTLLLVYRNGMFGLKDTATLRETERLRLPVVTNIVGVAISSDRKMLAVALEDASVKLISPSSAHELSSFLVKGTHVIRGLRFSPDGRTLAIVKGDQKIELWDTTGVLLVTEIETRITPGAAWFPLSFSPDGHKLAVGCEAGTVEVWDLPEGRKTTLLAGHQGGINDVGFSNNGKTLATTSYDVNLKLWHAETGKEVARIGGRFSGFLHLAFSPDDRRMVTGALGAAVTLWDIASPQPQEVGSLKAHKDDISYASFLPDGDTLVSLSVDGMMCVWRAPPFAEIDAVDKAKAKEK